MEVSLSFLIDYKDTVHWRMNFISLKSDFLIGSNTHVSDSCAVGIFAT